MFNFNASAVQDDFFFMDTAFLDSYFTDVDIAYCNALLNIFFCYVYIVFIFLAAYGLVGDSCSIFGALTGGCPDSFTMGPPPLSRFTYNLHNNMI